MTSATRKRGSVNFYCDCSGSTGYTSMGLFLFGRLERGSCRALRPLVAAEPRAGTHQPSGKPSKWAENGLKDAGSPGRAINSGILISIMKCCDEVLSPNPEDNGCSYSRSGISREKQERVSGWVVLVFKAKSDRQPQHSPRGFGAVLGLPPHPDTQAGSPPEGKIPPTSHAGAEALAPGSTISERSGINSSQDLARPSTQNIG